MSMRAIGFTADGVDLVLTITDGTIQIKMGPTTDYHADPPDMVIDLSAGDLDHLAKFINPPPYPDGGCVMCHKSKDDVMVVGIAKTKSGGVCESCAVATVMAAMKFATGMYDEIKVVKRMAEAKQKIADKTDTKPEEKSCQE